MERYVDAELAKEEMDKWDGGCNPNRDSFIDNIQAADVRKNIRGKWIKHGKDVECNKCGAIFSVGKHKLLGMWKFCPNCGADMRKESEE